MSRRQDEALDRRWRRELRAWDAGLETVAGEPRRSAMRRQVLQVADDAVPAPSTGAWWWATAAAAVLLATVVVALTIGDSPEPARSLVELAATAPASSGSAGAERVGGLDQVAAPEIPRIEPTIADQEAAAADQPRRIRRLALRAASGRQIRWILDSEFTLGERE